MVAERSVTVKLKIDNSDFIRGLAEASAAAKAFQRSVGGSSTDRFRTSIGQAGTDLRKFGSEADSAGKSVIFLGKGVGDSSHGIHEFSTATDKATTSTNKFAASTAKYARESEAFARSIEHNDRANKNFIAGLNTSSGQMAFLVQSALALGPALVPIGAVIVPAIAGLGTELGVAAGAATVALLAFQGIGSALKAVNDQALQPTDAHLRAMNLALAQLGPTGQQFVQFLQDAREPIQELQATAQVGLFPGLEEGISLLETQLPAVKNLIFQTAQALGQISAEAGQALSGPFWTDFLDFLSTTGVQILESTARAIGHLIQGVASLAEAFGPLTANFTDGFAGFADFFAKWAADLPKTQGFQDFIAFLEDAGPKVLDALESIGNAIVQIVQAASGVGLTSLQVISALADLVAAVAASPAGPALIALAAGISAVSRALAVANLVSGRSDNLFVKNLRSLPAEIVKNRAAFGALGIALSVAGSQVSDTDKALNGLVSVAADAALGFSVGGPWGAAIGGGIGLLTGFTGRTEAATAATAALADETKRLAESGLDKQGDLAKQGISDIVTALKDAGADVDAIDLGVPFNKLVEAATGAKPAIAAVTSQIDATVAAAKATKESIEAQLAVATDPATVFKLKGQLADATANYIDLNFAAQGVKDTLNGQNQAVEDARQSWQDMKETGETTNEVWKEMKSNIDAEADSARAAAAAHNLLTDSILANVEGMIAFRNGVRDAIAGAKGFTGSIDDQTKAGDAQKLALAGVADLWNNATEASKAAPGAYAKATRQFIRTAEAMNVNRKEAERLAGSWLHLPDPALAAEAAAKQLAKSFNALPKDVRIAVSALGTDATKAEIQKVIESFPGLSEREIKIIMEAVDNASVKINSVSGKLTALDGKTATVTIFERHLTSEGPQAQPPSRDDNPTKPKKADGGLLTGPGSGRSDSIPILASNGEFIVNAESTRKHLALLSSINNRQFAEGGTVGFARGGRVLSQSDISRIALRSDLPAFLGQLVAALADLRDEARDVVAAEKDVKAAREASREATRQLNQVQDTSSKLYKDRAKAQRAADKDLQEAEDELTKQRDQLSKATDKWKQKQQELIAQAQAVQTAVLGQGSIFGGDGTSVTVAGMLAKLHQAAKAGREFNRNIAELRAEGLDERLIQQLLDNAGTPEAQAAAENLANASKRQIKALNTSEGQLLNVARRSGGLSVTGGGDINVKFTGNITTTDVTNLDKKLARRIKSAVRVAVQK